VAEVYTAVNGNRVSTLRLRVANVGPWFAEVDFEQEPELDGAVTITVGDTLSLQGTISPEASGTFGLQRKVRIVAGGGGWGQALKPKNYHNDAGVKARSIAEDAAREVGEQLGGFVPAAERVGADYVRNRAVASAVLEEVIGAGVPWWVDFAGVTQVGPRAAAELDPADYEVLAFDPRARLVTLGVDDPSALQIGSIVSERLDAPLTVREFELLVTPEELRIRAWCPLDDASEGRLPGLLRTIVERVLAGRLLGKYRYRVLKMAGDRVELQAVSTAAGLPDVLPVSMWPGLAGAHAELERGAEVLVEFLEGRRTMPVVTGFAGKDGKGFVPVSLTLGGTTGPEVARKGDAVEVVIPPMVFAGQINGSPASGTVSATLPKALGVITAGSSKVKVAS
jgi:hypothetical protein